MGAGMEIHIENIERFINHPGLPEFYLTMSPLANPAHLGAEEYRRWLWNRIKPRDGRRGDEYNAIGYLARLNKRTEVILLTHEDDPEWVNVVIAAVRWYQAEYLREKRA